MTHQVFGLAMAERKRYAVAYPSLMEALRLNPRNTEAESALARLRELLEPNARATTSLKVTLMRYPSGAPQEIVQVRTDTTGRYIPFGIMTQWYEDGELKRFVDYADGVPHGVEVLWDPSGRVIHEPPTKRALGRLSSPARIAVSEVENLMQAKHRAL
jgi:hypothetical protein